ncbi:MAG TPA: NAD(P)-dependent oxidoreductase [Vicinamibacterales bacterium]|jgi:nucleoside-diphosphate-sugar epimerase|nr:NAD(P)-dependent oxidoreductase [Vicinamibacterales bacterium]
MKVLIAGATGAIGRPLVRALVRQGHEVIGLTRTAAKRPLVESLGARAAIADALDGDRLAQVVAEVAPSHVVHLLTALPAAGPMRARDLRPTNALRVHGTANLLRAAIAARVSRIVAESFIGIYGRVDFDRPRGEDGPLAPVPDGPTPRLRRYVEGRRSLGGGAGFREAALALRSLEDQLARARESKQIETVTLRYGGIYGPDVPSLQALVRLLRSRRVFLPRGANGIMSFVHVDDAAEATVLALEHPSPGGVYNIVDDEPMPLARFVDMLASAAGAPPPRTAPAWLFRVLAPLMLEAMAVRMPLSNAKAKRELGWRLAHPTATDGLPGIAELKNAA